MRMHWLAYSTCVLLLFGLCADVTAQYTFPPTILCDRRCKDAYYSNIVTLEDSKYPNCTINVGGCYPVGCGKKCGKECRPKYRTKRQWCGPGDIRKVRVVKKCKCRKVISAA